VNSYWVALGSTQKITVNTKSLKICYLFNTTHIRFKMVHRRTEITHQQQLCHSGSRGCWTYCYRVASTFTACVRATEKTVWAYTVEKWWYVTCVTFWETITVSCVCCYLVNHFWVDECATQYIYSALSTMKWYHIKRRKKWIYCFKRPNYDFCILQGSNSCSQFCGCKDTREVFQL